MDSFEWNKIAGWALTAAITVLGLSIITGAIYSPHTPKTPAYEVQGVEAEAGGNTTAVAEKPIAFYLASASVEKGAAQFKKCAACHTITPGGPNGIGPNLYGVVGKPHGHLSNFSYSSALKAKPGPWTFDELNAWLTSPKAYAPGTKMAFAGLAKPEDRAAVIAYLNQQSPSPLPLPPVPTETAPVAGASGDKPATQAGKAPDVPVASANAAAAQPEHNRGGPAATDVTGTSKTDKH